MIDFMIIGAQKSATSTLHACLRSHHDIYMPKGESPFFEDPDFQDTKWTNIKLPKSKKLFGIKRPDILCEPTLIKRVYDTHPSCKFIVVLRDPITRSISSYYYMIRHGHIKPAPISVGMQNCINDFENGVQSRYRSVISYSLYGNYLNNWLRHYRKENFLIIEQKQISENFYHTINLCLNFLEVDCLSEKDILKGKKTRSNAGLYDTQMLKLAYFSSLIKTKKLNNSPRRINRNFPTRAVGVGLSKLVDYLADNNAKPEKLSDRHRSYLTNLFRDDVCLLERLFERDFNSLKKEIHKES